MIQLFGATSSAASADQLVKADSKGSAAGASVTSLSGSHAEDTTSLTSASDSVQGLTRTALAPDAARAARVQSLKQSVSEGTYALEPGEIASSLSSATI